MMRRLTDPLLIALFALLFLTTFSSSGQTEGLVRPDSDGKVPVKQACDMQPNADGYHWMGKHQIWAVRNASGQYLRTDYVILINKCYMDSQGAGPTDTARVLAHEQAHARGLDHGEETPRTNAAFYPFTTLCHC